MCVWEKNFVWTFSISKNLNKRINIVNLQTKLATERITQHAGANRASKLTQYSHLTCVKFIDCIEEKKIWYLQ